MTLHNRSVPKEHCLETSKWCGNIKAAIQCERKSERRRMTQTEKKRKDVSVPDGHTLHTGLICAEPGGQILP